MCSHPHPPQLMVPNENNQEGTSQEKPGIYMKMLAVPIIMTHHYSSFSPSSFILDFFLPLVSLSFFLHLLFLFPLSPPFSFHILFLLYLFPSPLFLSLTKHPFHIHVVSCSFLGFGEHRDKYMAGTCIFFSSSYQPLSNLFVNRHYNSMWLTP